MTSRTIPFLITLLVAVVIASATFVEERLGTDTAHTAIYGAWWFVVLWGVTALAATWLLIKKKMWLRPAVLMIHVSLLVILAGALVTHMTSKSGQLHLRLGEASPQFWVKTDNPHILTNERLPFYICLKDFHIDLDADSITPADYVSTVVLATREGERECRISMNNIGREQGYRIYQTSYDEDGKGSLFTISYDPWGTGITYLGYILLAISMTWNLLQRKKPTSIEHEEKKARIPAIFMGIVGTLLASYMVIAIAGRPLLPVLRSPFLAVHVGTICISYILLVMSIVRRKLLRPAVFFLAAGIFLGAVWANVSWGSYWSWDPKEAWALVTLLIYSIPLHTESLPWFRSDKHYRIYSMVALASLLMTYFGVNYLLGGMHSYVNG